MSYCHGCLKDNVDGFCSACENKLFDRSKVPTILNFDWDDIKDKILGSQAIFSISGVQIKALIGRDKNKLLAPNRDIESMYIVKPFLDSRRKLHLDSPANEHLTMQMANQLFNIPTAACAYMHFADDEPVYLTRRFDRNQKGEKLRQEDFVSILNVSASDKYYKYTSSSYEDVGLKLNPIDRIKFIRLLIFNFLSGNGDVHLKNISMLESVDGDMILSPAYDLMNTKLHIDDSYIALNLFAEMERTKEKHFENTYPYTIKDFIELGSRLEIKTRLLDKIIEQNREKENDMIKFIDRSFLSDEGKQKYQETINKHYKQLFA